FIFSSYSPAHPPLLHSFPTRRSSDLTVSSALPRNATCLRPRSRTSATSRSCAPATTTRLGRRSPCRTTGPSPARSSPTAPTAARSEEHTSELQSRENLVCRLLLEKKK